MGVDVFVTVYKKCRLVHGSNLCSLFSPPPFFSPLQTPERKIKGHFSTGHAESPATIVVGRAYSTTVRTAGQVPKVVKNPILKLNMNMDESFTGKFLKCVVHSANCVVLLSKLMLISSEYNLQE